MVGAVTLPSTVTQTSRDNGNCLRGRHVWRAQTCQTGEALPAHPLFTITSHRITHEPGAVVVLRVPSPLKQIASHSCSTTCYSFRCIGAEMERSYSRHARHACRMLAPLVISPLTLVSLQTLNPKILCASASVPTVPYVIQEQSHVGDHNGQDAAVFALFFSLHLVPLQPGVECTKQWLQWVYSGWMGDGPVLSLA